MTAKTKKRKRQQARAQRGEVGDLHASVEDDLLLLAIVHVERWEILRSA